MTKIFCCPICGTGLEGWPPATKCPSCSHTIPTSKEILIFTDEPNLNLEGEKRYVGYDSVAKAYARYNYSEELNEQLNIAYGKAIAELVGPKGVILDLGCGPGKYALEISQRNCRVIAGDISLNMLQILSSKLREIPRRAIIPCRLNAYRLPLLDQSINAVTAIHLLHFVGDAPQVIREIRRVLKPEGVFLTNSLIRKSPTDDLVTEIITKIRRYYTEILEKKGGKELKRLGWTSRQIRENLPKFFRRHAVVERDDLVFRFTETPRWFLQRLGSRYTAFQVGLDREIHSRTMREVHNRLASEYGSDFEGIEQAYCETHRLSVYSD